MSDISEWIQAEQFVLLSSEHVTQKELMFS